MAGTEGDEIKLTLAYAMSIHKSQGSGWDHVVVIADPNHRFMLSNGGRQLMYTGITRVQKLLTIIGGKKAFGMAATSPMSNLRQTYLAQFNPDYSPEFFREDDSAGYDEDED